MGTNVTPVGKFGEVVTEHSNSEGEVATIERVAVGDHKGELLLCFYDEASPDVAPMLLDESTRAWLKENL